MKEGNKNRICLVINFNHQYEHNIEKLERLYGDRFENIFYLMPFYEGKNPKVISVYENSFQFQGHFAQGLKTFYKKNFTHYIFLADDLLLNPKVNQESIYSLLNLDDVSAYIKSVYTLHDVKWYCSHVLPAINTLSNIKGVEYFEKIPAYHTAFDSFIKHNINIGNLTLSYETKSMLISNHCKYSHFDCIDKFALINNFLTPTELILPYPIVGAYSDFVVVPKLSIKKFCRLCGIFAAMRLFAEIAIPTALLLTCDNIIFENKDFPGLEIWGGENIVKFCEECNYNLKTLFNKYESKLYIHPIKLSQWDF
jgi:hypothetical protein